MIYVGLNCCRSSTMCVASAGFTSFFNGLVVFTLLGYMAKQSGMDIREVSAQSGYISPVLADIYRPLYRVL